MTLHDELHSLKKQKADLEEETSVTLSVPEEIEKLTQKVKAANNEIANITKHTSATIEQINKLREQIAKVERAMQENKCELFISRGLKHFSGKGRKVQDPHAKGQGS